MNTSTESESSSALSVARHDPAAHQGRFSEPTLARVAQEDPNSPPLFELRAEYAIDPDEKPCILSGTLRRMIARTEDLMLSAIYFIGFGAIARLVRSRDPFRLEGGGSMRWLPPAATTMRARIGSHR